MDLAPPSAGAGTGLMTRSYEAAPELRLDDTVGMALHAVITVPYYYSPHQLCQRLTETPTCISSMFVSLSIGVNEIEPSAASIMRSSLR